MKLSFIPEEAYSWRAYDGRFGYGKTVELVRLAAVYGPDYPGGVFANFHIDLPYATHLERFDQDTLFRLRPNSLLLLTEFWNHTDKRLCMLKDNVKTTQSFFQVRKLDVDVVVDTPHVEWLDFRVFELVNQFCRAYGRVPGTSMFAYGSLTADKTQMTIIEDKNVVVRDMALYYPLYNTKEVLGLHKDAVKRASQGGVI